MNFYTFLYKKKMCLNFVRMGNVMGLDFSFMEFLPRCYFVNITFVFCVEKTNIIHFILLLTK